MLTYDWTKNGGQVSRSNPTLNLLKRNYKIEPWGEEKVTVPKCRFASFTTQHVRFPLELLASN